MAGKENREIKNSVFVDLFYEDESAEANEIALFNATHDEPLPEGTKIRKFRVDNTIYMNFQNDISFDAGASCIIQISGIPRKKVEKKIPQCRIRLLTLHG